MIIPLGKIAHKGVSNFLCFDCTKLQNIIVLPFGKLKPCLALPHFGVKPLSPQNEVDSTVSVWLPYRRKLPSVCAFCAAELIRNLLEKLPVEEACQRLWCRAEKLPVERVCPVFSVDPWRPDFQYFKPKQRKRDYSNLL